MHSLRLSRTLTFIAALTVAAGVLVNCRKADAEVNPDSLSIGNDGEPVTVELSTSSRWYIEYENTWVKADPASGNGSATITLTAVPNNTGKVRTTRVLVNAGMAEGKVTVPVEVTQLPMQVYFSVDTLSIPKEGGRAEFDVLSDGPWEIMGDIAWITNVSPTSGVGPQKITVTATETDSRRAKVENMVFRMGSMNAPLAVRLEPLPNQRPEEPQLDIPYDSASNLTVLPSFRWKCSDPDGDSLSYLLCLSTDRTTWVKNKTTSDFYTMEHPLETLTPYWWKVIADDGNGRDNSTSESVVRTFTTGDKTHYLDGEWEVVLEAKVPDPVKLVFMGDGYIKDDCTLGGKFMAEMVEGVKALFEVEPFRSYKDYFEVYVMVAYSEQRGMTIKGKQTRNTRFKVTKTGDENTALTCDEDTVFMYAEKIPVVKGDLENTAIFLMSSQSIYAGTCYMYTSGESIAIIPVSRLDDPTLYTDYPNILRHEGGGHAFGYLADEYVIYEGNTLPQKGEWSVEAVERWQSVNKWENISTTRDSTQMLWFDLMGKGYSAISNPQGALYYSYGAWRSEEKSCMIDNMPYYSAAQRLTIVKRIKRLAGEQFSLEDFIARDTVRTPPASFAGSKDSGFKPLGKPVLKERRR